MASNFERIMEERKKLVDQIIDNMKNGYLIPKSQWNQNAFRISNPISGARYRGANMLKLYIAAALNGYKDNRWMTYKQATSKGYYVKQGEKGIRLEKYIFDKVIEKENPDTGKMEKVRVKLAKPMINTFVVFNGEQIEGIPELVMPEIKQQDSEIWDIADSLIASSECPVKEEAQGQAYYSPQRDSITLPPREIFTSPEAFTTTLIHEMCHSTGHESRLNRKLLNSFGSPEYALEELRAELGAFFMGSDLGIEGSEELLASHTQYLESWISVLENDPNELFRAMSDSQKAVDRLTDNLERYREKTNEKINLQEYVNEHPQIGLDGKPIPRERPTIYCEWSEHGAFQEETVYDASEFNKIMERVDQEKVNLNKRIASLGEPVATNIGNVPLIDYLDIQASQYGYDSYETMLDEGMSIGDYSYVTKELIDKWRHNEQYSYDKVKYEVYVPGMKEITVRQDIGDGFGGVKSFLQQNGYREYADRLTVLEYKFSQSAEQSDNQISDHARIDAAVDDVMEQMALQPVEPDIALEL